LLVGDKNATGDVPNFRSFSLFWKNHAVLTKTWHTAAVMPAAIRQFLYRLNEWVRLLCQQSFLVFPQDALTQAV